MLVGGTPLESNPVPMLFEPAFIELPVKSSTLVELTFLDGTTLRVRG